MGNSCRANSGDQSLSSYQEIMDSYKAIERCENEKEIGCFEKIPNLEDALERAACAVDENGIMYDHQRRVGAVKLEEFYKELTKYINDINAAKDFEDLLEITSRAAEHVLGVGDLAAYDTAVRIGAHLDRKTMLPKRVYLHAGVKKAATYMGLGRGKSYLEVEELPPVFIQLEPYQLENLMCVYRDKLRKLGKWL